MLTISKSKLKAQMLKVFREIEESGEGIVVTDHGKPVIQILPFQEKKSVEEAFADWHGQAVFYEDMNIPTIDEWDETE